MKEPSYIALLLLLLVSCKDKGTEPFSEAYEQWRSYGLHAYTIDQTRSCFCLHGGEIMRVTVRADTVENVLRLSDSTQLPYSQFSLYLTVDSLFGLIRSSPGDSLVITYDTHYGYPKFLDIDPQLHPADGGILYETSNFRIE